MLVPLLLLLLATASPAAGDGGATPVVNPFSYFCNSTTVRRTFLPNSRFAANLATLAAALPRNASASPGGVFSAGAFGAAPDTAYGSCSAAATSRARRARRAWRPGSATPRRTAPTAAT
ncbi:hypothetical protein EJB05_12039, partial [Eragrostis curvula]